MPGRSIRSFLDQIERQHADEHAGAEGEHRADDALRQMKEVAQGGPDDQRRSGKRTPEACLEAPPPNIGEL